MKNKLILGSLFVLAIIIVSVFLQSKKNSDLEITAVKKLVQSDAKLHHQFVESQEGWVGRVNNLEVTLSDLENDNRSFLFKKKESDLYLILSYMQFVFYPEKKPKKITFHLDSSESHLRKICNQYGVPYIEEVNYSFIPKPSVSTLLIVDGKSVLSKEIKKDHYLWGAFQTEKFNWQLTVIDKILKNKLLVEEAKKLEINVQDYRAEYINQYLKMDSLNSEFKKFKAEKSFDSTKEGEALAKRAFKDYYEKKGLDFFLEKYVLDLPIQVNLKQPNFKPQLGIEYVPTKGPKRSEVNIILFSDSNSQSSHEILKKINQLEKEYSGIRIEYRPIISGQNIFQDLREKINYCVWQQSPEEFWSFLTKTQGFFNEKTQEKLFEKVIEMNLSVGDIELCLKEDLTEKIIDYQKKYSEYLGIHSGPVALIEGEVLTPPLTIEQIIRVINRRMGFADAAVW